MLLRIICMGLFGHVVMAQTVPQGKGSQTIETNDCATIFQPLLTAMPALPSDLASFWKQNNPQTRGCLAQPPSSLTSAFTSIYNEYGSWVSSNAPAFSSIASKCPQYDFSAFGNVFGGAGQAKQPQFSPTTSLRVVARTTGPLGGAGLPTQWAAFATYTPCSAIATPTSFTTETGSLQNTPTSSADISTTSRLTTSGARENTVCKGVGFMSGLLVVLAHCDLISY